MEGGLVMAKSGRLELGDNVYGHNRFIFNHRDAIGKQSSRIRWEKTQNNGYYASQGHSRSSSFVCDFLLVINSTYIIYRFGVTAAYCSHIWHFAFWATVWGFRDIVRCSSWAHWKERSGLLISVNWTSVARCYGWGATGENRSKIRDFAPTRSFWPKLSGRMGGPHKLFLHR